MRLVVQAEGLVGVLHKLVHRERAVVRLDDRVRDLRRRHDRERQHHAVRVLLADLGDQERAHAGAGAAAEGVRDLEALKAVAALRLLTDNVEHGVDELRTLRVMALRPVVAGASRPVEIEGGGKT